MLTIVRNSDDVDPFACVCVCEHFKGIGPEMPQDLSFLPVLGVVLFGVSITAFAAAGLRVKGARALAANPPSPESVIKILKQRKLKERCRDFDASIMTACTTGVVDLDDVAAKSPRQSRSASTRTTMTTTTGGSLRQRLSRKAKSYDVDGGGRGGAIQEESIEMQGLNAAVSNAKAETVVSAGPDWGTKEGPTRAGSASGAGGAGGGASNTSSMKRTTTTSFNVEGEEAGDSANVDDGIGPVGTARAASDSSEGASANVAKSPLGLDEAVVMEKVVGAATEIKENKQSSGAITAEDFEQTTEVNKAAAAAGGEGQQPGAGGEQLQKVTNL